MFKIKNKLYTGIAVMALLVSSCKQFDLDINNNPNNPTSAPANLLLSSAQINGVLAFEGVNRDCHGYIGLLQLQGTDSYNINNNSYNGTWSNFYAGPAKDVDELIKLSNALGNPHYLGMGQVLKAFYFGLFVDLFNDVPYSEAFKGNDASQNYFPKFDKASDIYADLIKLCDEAVVNFGKTSPVAVRGDLFYNANLPRWIKLANTVKLKLIMNSRQVRPNAQTEIAALINSSSIINSAADEFIFRYNKVTNPDGRHLWFRSAYTGTNTQPYFSYQYMLEMLDDEDPRLPFIVRRQTNKILSPDNPSERGTIPAFNAYLVLDPGVWQRLYINKGKTPVKADSLYIAGFFGRKRGDDTGIPLDNDFRAAPACYPAGGLYDYGFSATPARLTNNSSQSGNGTFPLITQNIIRWWRIEYQLAYGVGTPRTEFENAIKEAILNVAALSKEVDQSAPSLDTATASAPFKKYVNLWLARYDAATTDAAKLDIVLKQAWFSNYGNGLEVYNSFRRNALPSSLDAPANRIRQFALRLPYPSQELDRNPNASAYKANNFDVDAIFWDVKKFKF
jgi:Starch-binding associating with outer membrane/Susd and RagB outer membrane lipoprotein